eukprot:6182378-Pleurochrysis_carterae.AAC.2
MKSCREKARSREQCGEGCRRKYARKGQGETDNKQPAEANKTQQISASPVACARFKNERHGQLARFKNERHGQLVTKTYRTLQRTQ